MIYKLHQDSDEICESSTINGIRDICTHRVASSAMPGAACIGRTHRKHDININPARKTYNEGRWLTIECNESPPTSSAASTRTTPDATSGMLFRQKRDAYSAFECTIRAASPRATDRVMVIRDCATFCLLFLRIRFLRYFYLGRAEVRLDIYLWSCESRLTILPHLCKLFYFISWQI